MSAARKRMNDFRLIKQDQEVERHPRISITPELTLQWHREQRTWLEEVLTKPFLGKTVVVTHMGPSARSIAPKFRRDELTPAFVSALDHLFPYVDLWIHGHTHASLDYQADGCRVVCNPRGYWKWDGSFENADFNPNLVVEI
jgi:hypothetical protein